MRKASAPAKKTPRISKTNCGLNTKTNGLLQEEDAELEAQERELEEPERTINPAPIKENGEPSYEFEPEDIERAEDAPAEVREYCAGAVSEAQEVGCLSHVEADEVP